MEGGVKGDDDLGDHIERRLALFILIAMDEK